MSTVKSCEVQALPKKGNGIRPILPSPVLRRASLSALCIALKTQVCEAAGPHQYGEGLPSGAEAASPVTCIATNSKLRPAALTLDSPAAFHRTNREVALTGAAADIAGPEAMEHEASPHCAMRRGGRWRVPSPATVCSKFRRIDVRTGHGRRP